MLRRGGCSGSRGRRPPTTSCAEQMKKVDSIKSRGEMDAQATEEARNKNNLDSSMKVRVPKPSAENIAEAPKTLRRDYDGAVSLSGVNNGSNTLQTMAQIQQCRITGKVASCELHTGGLRVGHSRTRRR